MKNVNQNNDRLFELESNTELEREIDISELGYFLLEKAKYIVGASVIGAIIALLITMLLITPQYTATTKVYVLNAKDSIINVSDLQLGNYLAADYKELFSSKIVLEKVVEKLHLNYNYKTLEDRIEITNPKDTRILSITATANTANEAYQLANTYAEVACGFIAETMETSSPNIYERATVSESPSFPSKTKAVLIGFGLGLIISCCFFIVRYILDDRIKTPEDIEKYLQLVTIGMLPKQDNGMQLLVNQRNKKKAESRS